MRQRNEHYQQTKIELFYGYAIHGLLAVAEKS
jgi:hypothetical protein